MKKVDSFSFTLSLIINVLILLIMSFNAPKKAAGKLKVGLVALDNKGAVNYEGFKDVTGKTPIKPPEPPKPDVPKTKEPENQKTLSLEERLQEIEISAPKIDTPSTKGVVVKKDKKSASSSSQQSSEQYAEAPIKTIGSVSGIPSGYKLGSADGDIIADWSPSNRNPVYPQSAQAKGLNGSVRLRLTIDEYGNVLGVAFEKGSGVPEINLAIEQVARTWKINLKKKGKTVYGDVILEYNFKLTGN
ncbi:MAG: energy transducer TonB [Fusobacteriaceae bacterium]